jgi:hypothetical protein
MFRMMIPGWSVCKGGVQSSGVFVTLLASGYVRLLYLALSVVGATEEPAVGGRALILCWCYRITRAVGQVSADPRMYCSLI